MVQNLEWVDSSVRDWCIVIWIKKQFLLDWLSIFRPQGNLALVWKHQLTCSSAESSSLKQFDSLKIDMWMNQFWAINEWGWVESNMNNYADRGGCSARVDNTLQDLLNSLYPAKEEFINIIALLFIQNNSEFKNVAKTCLPASTLSSSSIVFVQLRKIIFSK